MSLMTRNKYRHILTNYDVLRYLKRMVTKFRILILISLSLMSSASALASFKVKFDCYLPGDTINCSELEKSLFGQFGYLAPAATAAEVELLIQVRSNPIAGAGTPASLGTAYVMNFLGAGELPQFTLIDRIPGQVSDDNRFVRLLSNIDKGMAPFLAVSAPAITVGGETTMVFEDPHEGPPTSTESSNSRFYFAPSLSGNYSKTQIEVMSGRGSLATNWSSDVVRVQGNVNGSYSKIVLNLPGSEPISASVVSAGAQTIISYSFAKHWSLAVIAAAGHEPASNQKKDMNAGVGVEWVMVPFMKTSERNFSVRYAVGAEYQEFVTKNLRDEDSVLFARHMIELYCFWHFTTFDVSVGAGASSPVNDMDYLKLYGSTQVTFRLTKSLTLGVNLSASRQKLMINQPGVQDTSNPIQSMISGGSYSDTSFSSIVTLSYLFGNSALNYQDQRWRNFGK